MHFLHFTANEALEMNRRMKRSAINIQSYRNTAVPALYEPHYSRAGEFVCVHVFMYKERETGSNWVQEAIM